MIFKENLKWLVGCPSGDINFKNHLDYSNIETLQEALKDNSISKTARRVIESRIKKLSKGKNEIL